MRFPVSCLPLLNPLTIHTPENTSVTPVEATLTKTGGVGSLQPSLRPLRVRTPMRAVEGEPLSSFPHRDGENGPGAQSLVHCLAHGGSHPSIFASPSCPRVLVRGPKFPSPSPIKKGKRANMFKRLIVGAAIAILGVFGGHIPSRTRTNPSGKGSRGPISRENQARRPRCHQGPFGSAVEFQSRPGSLVHRAMRGAHRRSRRLHSRDGRGKE